VEPVCVGCSGTTGSGAIQLKSPRDLKFDASGNLYVSDQGNNRVQKFIMTLPSNCSASK
jgi:DNA-binding beta-propeller fold protein YncE